MVFVGGVFRESIVVVFCNEDVNFCAVVCDVYDDGGSVFVCFCDNGVVCVSFVCMLRSTWLWLLAWMLCGVMVLFICDSFWAASIV